MNATALVAGIHQMGRQGLGAPVLLLLMLCMVVIPLPPFALDVLFTFNISLALVVMLASVYSTRPLEFAIFPTVLLVSTLLRLGLNVASTRVVLLQGHTGTDAAGKVIESFGAFVIGGNYAVGLVVFAILVIINFVVVTKGAGRISEVSARFTLDAMPGKQMAIDADLNAGVLSQEEAKARRQEVGDEADFYGAMDGASKFVRGDAIAGLLILVINMVGGIAIGTLDHGMAVGQAGQYYALLTIGDGLVAQIPSLLLSSAAAIMVTRVSTTQDMSGAIVSQLFQSPRTVGATAAVMATLGVLPGMPNFAFLTVAALLGTVAWYLHRQRAAAHAGAEDERRELEPVPAPVRDVSWDDVQPLDRLGLDVGYRLISLVDVNQQGELLERVKSVRRKRTSELGFLIPSVHIRDALDLEPNQYRIKVMGVSVGEGEIYPSLELAIDSGSTTGRVDGQPTRDPVFGLEAYWIQPGQRDLAQALGYMVFDPCTVLTTHLDKIIVDFAHELLTQPDVERLLERVREEAPKLLDGMVPDKLPMSVLQRVMTNLLEDQIPLLNVQGIVETLAEHVSISQDPDYLTARVRAALGRFIVQEINGLRSELAVVVLDPALDQILQQQIQTSSSQKPGLDPDTLMRVEQAVGQAAQMCATASEPTVLLVADALRSLVTQLARRFTPRPSVLAFGELPDSQQIRSVGRVGGGEPAIPGR